MLINSWLLIRSVLDSKWQSQAHNKAYCWPVPWNTSEISEALWLLTKRTLLIFPKWESSTHRGNSMEGDVSLSSKCSLQIPLHKKWWSTCSMVNTLLCVFVSTLSLNLGLWQPSICRWFPEIMSLERKHFTHYKAEYDFTSLSSLKPLKNAKLSSAWECPHTVVLA